MNLAAVNWSTVAMVFLALSSGTGAQAQAIPDLDPPVAAMTSDGIRIFSEEMRRGEVLQEDNSAREDLPVEPSPALPAADNRQPIFFSSAFSSSSSMRESGDDPENRIPGPLLKHLAGDQKEFWLKPLHLHSDDARVLAPFMAFTGGLIAGDSWLSRQSPTASATVTRSKTFSDYATYSLIAASGAAYFWGRFVHNDHLRETGFLAGEAALNSTAVAYLLKTVTERPRPFENGAGRFFQRGNSFPSEHSAIAWSVASVVAHEYPGTLTKLFAYGLASGVMLTRVTGQQHFPSDVAVGSALGWYFARQVYRAHHDPELGGAGWGTVYRDSELTSEPSAEKSPSEGSEGGGNFRRMGSNYVALDSWIYPALERLRALGYAEEISTGMKPWTRLECAQMVAQVSDETVDETSKETINDTIGDLTHETKEKMARGESSGIPSLISRLRSEFAYEFGLLDGGRNRRAYVDSAYLRTVSISGPALTDSYHFGQTVAYDFGRPFERGTNGQAGASFSAQAGPFSFYLQGEYQHAPAAPPPSDAVAATIARVDDNPAATAIAVMTPAVNRPQLLDTYVTLNLGAIELDHWQLSVGRESHSWGPGPGGSLLLSTNSAPIDMVELSNPSALRLRGFLKFLGPVRTAQFIGRLSGRTDHANPWVYGQKISFHPLANLEIGYGRMTTLGGRGGDPFTVQNFAQSLFGQVNSRLGSVPGDSDNEMDWTFYVPKVRNYLVLYGEVYAEDDFIAWVRPTAYPFRPGIYLTRFPCLPNLDLHLEAASTEAPGWRGVGGGNTGQFIYFDGSYHEANTNRGFLLGNTVGRMGETLQGWVTYWVTPRQTLQFTYKHNFVDSAFIPGGGAWQDYALHHEINLNSGLYAKTEAQYEHISRYPLLFAGPQNNFTLALEIGVHPFRKSR